MGFNTALSGIKASADFLSTTGNNIANSDTTGFKKSRVEFGDLYNTNVIGAGSSNTIGSGVAVNNIAQEFSSGNISDTGNNLDLAIDGTGFFVLDVAGTQAYTRAGDFKLNEEGYLVTNDGANVQGYNATNGIVGGALEDLQVPTERIAPEASSQIDLEFNLDSRLDDKPPYIESSFDPGDPDTYTFTQTSNNTNVPPQAVTLYYAKSDGPNTYQVYATVDGEQVDPIAGTPYLGEQYVIFDDADGSFTETTAGGGTAIPFAPIYTGDGSTITLSDPTAITPISVAGVAFDFNSAQPDIALPTNFARPSFDPVDPDSYTYSNTNTIYDTLGEEHTIGYYFIKQGENNTWEMKITVDGEVNNPVPQVVTDAAGNPVPDPADPTIPLTETVPYLPEDTVVRFDNEGNLIGAYTGYEPYTVPSPTQLSITGWDPTDANAVLEIGLGDSTQYALSSSDTFKQDGYAAGELQGVSFDEDGMLIASYTNQQTAVLGQIALANFDNVDGLTPAGDTSWVASSDSGAANVGRPGTGTFGGIKGGSLEESNVDITEELVALIEAQRNYQANSKTLETENTVTQTIINLR
ncbi:Flagellar hook protein FlgE [Marinomonas gallaica]|uniref:Flagellar hook protein FlgE n=1 Tax=Marinomonas gallaica TaxID=1806667 RepID=A0A1C3JMD0_9GAMM|nr:flagellar hook protein FlgE [Marinomonas gallaica]SBT16363.1 Flagellar hook protein FlgE [Marinomonas gallaica]SBT21411.1 Flagellar hook protein FlgE [Marinomonas gallaica]